MNQRRLEIACMHTRSDFLLAEQTDPRAIRRRQRRELDALRRAGASETRVTETARKHEDEWSAAADAEEAREKRLGHTVAVRGRNIPSGRVWDIFRLCGEEQPRLVRGAIADSAEALAIARDLVLGRVSVSFAGVRGVFSRSSSKLLVPDRSIDTPGASNVRMMRVGEDVLLSTKGRS